MSQSGGVSGMLVTAIPTIVFVLVNTLTELQLALVGATVAAAVVLGWRLVRREPLRQAVIGLVAAAVCAGVAAFTGEAKGFFLLPILVPVVLAAACTVSILAGRPLAGLLFNRLVGGPPAWRQNLRLRRIYTWATVLFAAVNIVSFALQTQLYRANQTALLAAFHILTGPLRPIIIVITVVLARRTIRAGAT